jgi:hypothetical protein
VERIRRRLPWSRRECRGCQLWACFRSPSSSPSHHIACYPCSIQEANQEIDQTDGLGPMTEALIILCLFSCSWYPWKSGQQMGFEGLRASEVCSRARFLIIAKSLMGERPRDCDSCSDRSRPFPAHVPLSHEGSFLFPSTRILNATRLGDSHSYRASSTAGRRSPSRPKRSRACRGLLSSPAGLQNRPC